MTNMSAAQAAQQNNRDGAGKYQTSESPESGVELPPAVTGLSDSYVRLGNALRTVGECPECKNPSMRGQFPNKPGVFLPGSTCDLCEHTAPDLYGGGLIDGVGSVRTFMNRDGRFITSSMEPNPSYYVAIDTADDPAANTFLEGFGGDTSGSAAEYAAALGSRDLSPEFIEQICDDHGINSFTTAVEIIADRETVPGARLLTQITTVDAYDLSETFDNYGYHDMADYYASQGPDEHDEETWPTAADMALVKKACEDAGYSSMYRIYERLDDNGLISRDDANAMSADEVDHDYERFIGPAIDRVEDRMREEYMVNVASDAGYVARAVLAPSDAAAIDKSVSEVAQHSESLRVVANEITKVIEDGVVRDKQGAGEGLERAAARLHLVASALQRAGR